MPKSDLIWVHIQINTFCSWLKGDQRGFRAKHHELHSSGDYRNPPPQQEHAGLRRHFESSSSKEVHIDAPCRPIIGAAILKYLRALGYEVLAIAVAKVHAHVVVRLPNDAARIRAIFGEVKRKSSRAARQSIPGKVWSRGEHAVFIHARSHQVNAVGYVLFDQGPTAWTWGFYDAKHLGKFGRKRPAWFKKRRSRR